MSAPPATVRSIVDDLRTLGVTDGDTLMVHASLRALGPIEGGAAGLITALDGAVGARGTILMTLGALDEWDWVNDREEDEREVILRGTPAFDPLTTPADPDVGVLAEVLRTFPGTLVSDHPEGRFGARGANARTLVETVPWNHYYGSGSPLERLLDLDGAVLRLGADLDTVTLIHYAEYLSTVADKRQVRRHRMVLDDEGNAIVRTIDCLDDSSGIVEHPGEDYFATIIRSYLDSGRAQVGTVAAATGELIGAVDLVEFATEWMNRNLAAEPAGD